MRVFVERTLTWLIAAVVLGCGGDGDSESSEQFVLREEIPLGIISVSVTQWEEVRGSSSPLQSLRPPEGEKPVAVFVRWRGLDEYGEFDRRSFVEAFLSHRLTLVDSDGFEYAAPTAMTRDIYQFSAQAGSGKTAPPDWAVVFWAWVDSRDYELHIEHPNPGEGDFDVAVVELP
jgi:hypothetical protein